MKTLILAAGGTDYRNMSQGLTSSQLLTIVNGRPIISWVVGGALRANRGTVSIVLDTADTELKAFCRSRFDRLSRVDLLAIEKQASILYTLQAGMRALGPGEESIHVVLGDTLLNHAPFEPGDCLWVADFELDSRPWCVVDPRQPPGLRTFHNKVSGLLAPVHKALVGRYDFSDAGLLRRCLGQAIDEGKTEISDVLALYDTQRPLTIKEVQSADWIDFGHLEGVARAKSRLMESRSFNRLTLHPLLPIITKTSVNTPKLAQEIDWYRQLPEDLLALAPRVLGFDCTETVANLKMEYYGYGTLAEKFLFFGLSDSFWEAVLSKLMGLVELFDQYATQPDETAIDLQAIYQDKTFQRLDHLRTQSAHWPALLDAESIRINQDDYLGIPRLAEFIQQMCRQLLDTVRPGIVHGDLCFNNILYDVASGIIKLIDPRGEFGAGCHTIYGDPRYDIAKLRHSYCGNYDQIIDNNFEVQRLDDGFDFKVFADGQDTRDQIFDRLCVEYGYDPQEIHFIEALLFVSMVPLHCDHPSRQMAFFLNGILKLNRCYRAQA